MPHCRTNPVAKPKPSHHGFLLMLSVILLCSCLDSTLTISSPLLYTIITMKQISRIQRAERLLRVGLYDLEKTLGKGNFAIVRLGIHRLTKTIVAIKVVDKNDLDAENLKKISREIEIMRSLSHRHIVQLYQVMETDTFIHIVTEYAANGEIFDYLVKNGRMSEKDAAHKFAQILRYFFTIWLNLFHY